MRNHTHTETLAGLFVSAILFVGFSGSPGFADIDTWGGETLTWGATGSPIVAYDGWKSEYTSMSWSVTRDVVGGVAVGAWHYEYTFTAPAEAGELSHLIIEVSGPETANPPGPFSLDNPGDFINTQGYAATSVLVDTYYGTGNDKPNPYMENSLYGIKFEEIFGESVPVYRDQAWVANSWAVMFDSLRNPTWGDFYAVDGKGDESDPWAAAYNGTRIGVPDSTVVPVPAAVLVGLFGMGVTVLKLRSYV